MDRRAFVGGLAASLLAPPLVAQAQEGKVRRIGFLSLAAGPTATMDISPGLRELGWIEGRNITIEYRWAGNREDQLPALAAELVRMRVDVLVTSSTPAAWAAKRATSTIPIVATFVADPVGSALVSSLARPGGNLTGLTTLASGLVAKRLELLKDLLAKAGPVSVEALEVILARSTVPILSHVPLVDRINLHLVLCGSFDAAARAVTAERNHVDP